MCGICGIKTHSLPPQHVLEHMLEALYHRGPDASGRYFSNEYMAGQRRLAINDLKTGDQPLYNTRKDVLLFYNGEIYNSPELRQSLQKQGITFRTHSDGEVICHLYDLYGENLFSHLDGMFACALWIEKEKKLILARDSAGEKPLYYSMLPQNGLTFASEVKSLLRIPYIDRSLDYQALWDFPTFLWIPEPATAFSAIKSLPRGHILICDQNTTRIRPFSPFPTEEINAASLPDSELIEYTRAIVTQAVESRLLSDVPAGAFLSGGLDSSIIATLAARKLSCLDTFTIGFENLHDPYHGMADESAQAETTAQALGSRHHTLHVTASDFRALLPEFCDKGDLPFSVSSGLGVLAVSKLAREKGIKVLLTGDGADEAFGGYSWYPFLPFSGVSPASSLPQHPVSFQNTGLAIQKRLEILAAYSPPKRAWAWHYYAAEEEKTALFSAEPFAEIQSSLRHFGNYKSENWSAIDYIHHDQNFYFPFEMLCKADRMTMAASVEGRIPFAAPSIQALAKTLSFSQMIRKTPKGDILKWPLRKAFEDILPSGVATRQKHGFNVPVDYWLRNEWKDLFSATFAPSSALARYGLLSSKSEKTAHLLLHDPDRLNGHSLFSFIMLNIWLERTEQWK